MRRNSAASSKATARTKWALLATTLLMATAEAIAQEKPTHRATLVAQGATNSQRRIVGCIRMRNRDMEELFELVRAGDVVELHAGRTTELARLFGDDDAPAAVAA